MKTSIEEFVAKTLVAQTSADLGGALKEELAQEGYENLVVASTERRAVKELVWSDLPEGYAPTYLEKRWDRIDPVLHQALTSNRPFAWDGVARRPKELSADQKLFLGECKELGVHSGMTIPLHGPALSCDLLSVSARDPQSTPTGRLFDVYLLGTHAWFRLTELRERELPRKVSGLTPREVECLRWAKDGKTDWEIGEILAISERTVEFHIQNAMAKFGVNNRMLATVVALQNGFISL